MKTLTALVTVYGLILMPLYANAAALGGAPVFRPAPAARSAAEPSIAVGAEVRGRRAASTPVNEASSPVAYHSLLEAAEIAASSGAYRAQNTPDITTGLIREGDKKRSALAFALSGLLAFTGAALWRNLTCRGEGDARHLGEGLKTQVECYEDDGSRKGWDTPTKALFGAGIALELVSLGYLFAHMRSDDN
jgi:hypothetical protein